MNGLLCIVTEAKFKLICEKHASVTYVALQKSPEMFPIFPTTWTVFQIVQSHCSYATATD